MRMLVPSSDPMSHVSAQCWTHNNLQGTAAIILSLCLHFVLPGFPSVCFWPLGYVFFLISELSEAQLLLAKIIKSKHSWLWVERPVSSAASVWAYLSATSQKHTPVFSKVTPWAPAHFKARTFLSSCGEGALLVCPLWFLGLIDLVQGWGY